MYFDELYQATFVALTAGLSMILAALDRTVIDGIVNGLASVVSRVSIGAAWTDRVVVDGAVNGVGAIGMEMGQIARTPQSAGRVRWYVMALMLAVALGLTGVIIVTSKRLWAH
jgi:NADH-quinone oxidoreductase subunit L